MSIAFGITLGTASSWNQTLFHNATPQNPFSRPHRKYCSKRFLSQVKPGFGCLASHDRCFPWDAGTSGQIIKSVIQDLYSSSAAPYCTNIKYADFKTYERLGNIYFYLLQTKKRRRLPLLTTKSCENPWVPSQQTGAYINIYIYIHTVYTYFGRGCACLIWFWFVLASWLLFNMKRILVWVMDLLPHNNLHHAPKWSCNILRSFRKAKSTGKTGRFVLCYLWPMKVIIKHHESLLFPWFCAVCACQLLRKGKCADLNEVSASGLLGFFSVALK